MIKIVGVRFRTAGKIYYFDPKKLPIKKGDHVIVETARGIEYGSVVANPKEVSSADGTAESWRDYQRGVLATFDDTGTSVTLTDVKTNLGRTLTLDELKAVTRIDTMTAAD